MVIGGLAVLRWGEPRQTRDVDLALLTGLGGEGQFVDPILERYRPRIPDARRFALEHRVVLIETPSGVPVDISHAGLPFEARVIDRSTPFDIVEGAQFTTCSAEDPTAVSCIDTVLQKTTMFDSVLARGLMLIGTENARAVLEKMFMSDHDERHRIASDALVRFRQNGQ